MRQSTTAPTGLAYRQRAESRQLTRGSERSGGPQSTLSKKTRATKRSVRTRWESDKNSQALWEKRALADLLARLIIQRSIGRMTSVASTAQPPASRRVCMSRWAGVSTVSPSACAWPASSATALSSTTQELGGRRWPRHQLLTSIADRPPGSMRSMTWRCRAMPGCTRSRWVTCRIRNGQVLAPLVHKCCHELDFSDAL